MKDRAEIDHLTKFDALRMNRDEVMGLGTWFKSIQTSLILRQLPPKPYKLLKLLLCFFFIFLTFLLFVRIKRTLTFMESHTDSRWNLV